MREKRQRGMSVGDIGRLFGVTYHYAYQVVVVHAGRNSRSSLDTPLPLSVEGLHLLNWWQILSVTEVPAHSRPTRLRRATYQEEADRRDAAGDGSIYEQQVKAWIKAGRPES
jgi:hypothetical protein